MWSEFGKKRNVGVLVSYGPPADQIDGDEDATSNNGEDGKNVPSHAQEAQEDGGVEANLLDQLLFLDRLNRLNPAEEAAADWRRGMFLIGIFGSRSVDGRGAGTEDAKGEGEGTGNAKGVDEGGNDGGGLELGTMSAGVDTRILEVLPTCD